MSSEKSGYYKRYEKYYAQTNEKIIVRKKLMDWIGVRTFERTLDIGAGLGECSLPLYQSSKKLTLVEKRLEYERELRTQFPNANVLMNSINEMQFHEKFDCILYSHGLYYQQDWLGMCKQVKGWLAPGASLVIVMNADSGDWWNVVSAFNDLKKFCYTPLSRFKKELETLGSVKSDAFTYQVDCESKEDLIRFIGQTMIGVTQSEEFARHEHRFAEKAKEFCKNDEPPQMKWDAEILVLTP